MATSTFERELRIDSPEAADELRAMLEAPSPASAWASIKPISQDEVKRGEEIFATFLSSLARK